MRDDPATLRRALGDPDELVRSAAAVRLAELDDPAALDALVRTLGDGADPNHADVTPAVRVLAGMGERALGVLVAPLLADDAMTRLHAQRALEGAIDARHGFRSGQGFPDAAAEDAARNDLRAIGYAYDAACDAREAAVARLRRALKVGAAT